MDRQIFNLHMQPEINRVKLSDTEYVLVRAMDGRILVSVALALSRTFGYSAPPASGRISTDGPWDVRVYHTCESPAPAPIAIPLDEAGKAEWFSFMFQHMKHLPLFSSHNNPLYIDLASATAAALSAVLGRGL